MFSGDDEDGDFLSPSGGAKLASLFGLDQAVGQGNESFQYTAPKQPRKSSNPVSATQKLPPTSAAPAVLFATAVQAFRYINGQYVKQGKLGAAALGNHTTKEYKLLLYLSQQKQVTTAKIHTGFVFTVQPNNYYTFYDDQRQNWSLMFESEKASSDFCKEVCLAKVNSAASLDAVVVQDLNPGEGQEVENGDSLEVVYTGWLLQNHTIGQMFDSNQNKDKLLRLKIGAGKVIKGWEEGMLGMKKTGRRLIVVPPHLAYGSKGVPNRIPANSTLIFEAELRRVHADQGRSGNSIILNLNVFCILSLTIFFYSFFFREPPLRAKSNSLSEQLANPDATKAKLISRMAKMGQPMLPFLTGVTSQPESSDSELEPYSYMQTSVAPSQLQPVQTVPYMGKSPSDVTSFLMTEARQHNTEIRLAVGKVADKVDQLTSKGSVSMGVSSMSMETSMIMHNIQRIVQENECLKKEVFEKSSRVEEQNRKIGELINQNQRYMEQSNMLLEQRNDSLKSSSEQNQARILQAEQDKVRLTEDLASSVARLSQLQLEASSHQQRAVELQSKLGSVLQDTEGYCQRITALETQLEELKETAERTQAQYRSERQKRKETELRVVNMEEELQDLRADKEGLERTLVERKKKWQAERQQRDEEVEELRKSSQQELDNVRAQLRKARTSTDNAASEQLSQLQAELEQDWRGKCEQMLTSAKEQHRRDVAELTEQRDALQDSLAQLREKHTALERQEAAVREKLERKVAELEKKLAEQENSGDTAAEAVRVSPQVKRVMNGVFHSLRGEFDLGESYSGQAVLAVVVTTIKNVTLQLLSGTHESSLPHEEEEEEEKEEKEEEAEEEEEESDDVKHMEEKPHQNVHVNGEGQVGEEEQEEEEEEEQEGAELDSPRVSENQRDQEVSAQDKTETESKTQSQTEVSQAADLHPVSLSEVTPHETAAAECEGQRAQVEHSVPESPTEPRDADATAGPEDRHDRSSAPVDGQESAAVSREVDEENTVNGEHGGEVAAAPQEAFGPPANPPPPPDALQSGAR
uniref:peptidylprolyl isomerase n=1 Tax=Scophthalmus maximus TaxID=52904 RepID=A0A8D3CIP8_SCOMX